MAKIIFQKHKDVANEMIKLERTNQNRRKEEWWKGYLLAVSRLEHEFLSYEEQKEHIINNENYVQQLTEEVKSLMDEIRDAHIKIASSKLVLKDTDMYGIPLNSSHGKMNQIDYEE